MCWFYTPETTDIAILSIFIGKNCIVSRIIFTVQFRTDFLTALPPQQGDKRYGHWKHIMAVLEENITFVGASGTRYKFNAFTKNTSFGDFSAVYIFTRRQLDSDGTYKYRFLYVGESEELGTRIDNHEKWACVNRYDCNSICTHLVENDKSKRVAIQNDLINWGTSRPPCND